MAVVRIALLALSAYWVLCSFAFAQVPVDRPASVDFDQFLAILDTTRARFSTIHLRFKTKWWNKSPGPSSRECDGVFAGDWWYRNDGYERLETQMEKGEGQNVPTVEVKDQERQTTVMDVSGRTFAHVAQLGQANWGGNNEGMPGRALFPLAQLSPVESHVRQTFRSEGTEVVDGRDCLKISYEPFKAGLPEYNIRLTFWIDLDRDGLVIRQEFTRGGRRVSITDVEIGEVAPGKWFPLRSQTAIHPAKNGIHSSAPGQFAVLEIDRGSIELDQGIDPTSFALTLKPGTRVTDNVAGKHYVEGGEQEGTRTPPLTGKQMDASVEEADAQIAALDTTDSQRLRNWPYWAMAVISSIVVLFAALRLLRNRDRQ